MLGIFSKIEFSLSGEPPIEVPQAPARFPRNEIQCPSCGSPNPTTNRHCEECGARLSQGPLPVAPRPAVQATAGVRAVLAIAGLLTTVVIIAIVAGVLIAYRTRKASQERSAPGHPVRGIPRITLGNRWQHHRLQG